MDMDSKEYKAVQEILAAKFEVAPEDVKISKDGSVEIVGTNHSGKVVVEHKVGVEEEDITDKVHAMLGAKKKGKKDAKSEKLIQADEVEKAMKLMLQRHIETNELFIDALDDISEHVTQLTKLAKKLNKKLEGFDIDDILEAQSED